MVVTVQMAERVGAATNRLADSASQESIAQQSAGGEGAVRGHRLSLP